LPPPAATSKTTSANCPTSCGAIIIETVGVGARRGTGFECRLARRRVDDGPDELVSNRRADEHVGQPSRLHVQGRSSLIEIVPDRIFDLDPRDRGWLWLALPATGHVCAIPLFVEREVELDPGRRPRRTLFPMRKALFCQHIAGEKSANPAADNLSRASHESDFQHFLDQMLKPPMIAVSDYSVEKLVRYTIRAAICCFGRPCV
jgi:hypothetical protein